MFVKVCSVVMLIDILSIVGVNGLSTVYKLYVEVTEEMEYVIVASELCDGITDVLRDARGVIIWDGFGLSTLDCDIIILDIVASAHASLPSNQVYWAEGSPTTPHLSYHEPPGAQQLAFPDFLKVPHRSHGVFTLAIRK